MSLGLLLDWLLGLHLSRLRFWVMSSFPAGCGGGNSVIGYANDTLSLQALYHDKTSMLIEFANGWGCWFCRKLGPFLHGMRHNTQSQSFFRTQTFFLHKLCLSRYSQTRTVKAQAYKINNCFKSSSRMAKPGQHTPKLMRLKLGQQQTAPVKLPNQDNISQSCRNHS